MVLRVLYKLKRVNYISFKLKKKTKICCLERTKNNLLEKFHCFMQYERKTDHSMRRENILEKLLMQSIFKTTKI